MTKFKPLASVCRRLAAFRKDERGNVLMLFGLSLIPIIGLVGAASDYSRAATARTEMQTALDATALMVSKEATTLTPAQLTAKANTYFKGLFKRTDIGTVTVTASYSVSVGSRVTLTTAGTMNTSFMGILGINTVDIGASGTAVWGVNRLRVALVLDNSGSMAQSGKITALQTASHNLLNQLQAAASNPLDVYVSIVPFSATVNIGTLKSTQMSGPSSSPLWTTWTDYGSCSTGSGSYFSKTLCTGNSGTWTKSTSYSTWAGCVGDRLSPEDASSTAATSGTTSTYYWPNKYTYCNTGLMTLSNDWTALNAKVDAMSPNGNTNQAIGMQWGMMTLWGKAPATAPAKDANYQYNDVIILMTDGLNTSSRTTQTQSTIDTRTALACTNAKTGGATIYAIQVDTEGGAQSTMLKNCATDSGKYFYMNDAATMVSVFDQIGTAISKLRIES